MEGKKCVGILTSGGDAPGMNAAIRAVTRAAIYNGFDVKGIMRGYKGLITDEIIPFQTQNVSNIIQQGGTILKTARCEEFRTPEGRKIAYDNIIKHGISALVVIGGDGSLTGARIFASEYNFPIVGVPGTIDNDLFGTDHCPGFASAAKYIATSCMEVYQDARVYDTGMVCIIEIMGRHAGWLAASCCVTGDVDLVVLPEIDFDKEAFLAEVKKKFDEKGECYIVVSEGAHYADGTYLSAGDTANDGFAHAVLGGAGLQLKQMIIDSGIVPRGVVQDLSRAARSSNFAQSLTDVTEAYELGMSAHMRSANPAFTAQVVGIERETDEAGNYCARYFAKPACEFANFVKHFPTEWILPNYQGITQEAIDYFKPLMAGEPKLIMDGAVPATIVPFNKR